MSSNSEHEIRQKLAAEVDLAPWSALARHFAFGRVYIVRPPWDLVDAALALQSDAADLVKEALSQKRLEKPTDAEAQTFAANDTAFAMLIVSPFVLIQAPAER